MKYDFVVLGANGIQGKIVAKDLVESGYKVLLAANDYYQLDTLLESVLADFAQIDLRKPNNINRVIRKSGAEVIINCTIDDYNLAMTQLALENNCHYLDLGSEEEMTYAQLKLHSAFEQKQRIAITGLGSTPGINNVMLRYIRDEFDSIHTVHLGFAWNSNLPIFIPPFSIDAIAVEYSEPAKILEKGVFVNKNPWDCPIDYEYLEIGKQLTYYTKHIEHHTFYEYLKDAGIQNVIVCSSFPEHSHRIINSLIELGLTSKESLLVDGVTVRPLDFTIEALRKIQVPLEYKETENLWLKVFGSANGKEKCIEMDCIAKTLPGWEDAGCNIDTGLPTSIVAQMVKNREITSYGVFPPEFIVPPEPFFQRLSAKGLEFYKNRERIY